MYVRYQVPVGTAGRRLVTLIHGCCLTGKTWETTLDGRMGWDEYFVRRGHPTYVIDQAWRSRSAASPAGINRVRTGRAPVDELLTVFSAGHDPAWAIFRFGAEHPQVFPGMLFPLEAQGEFWKQMVPDWLNSLPTPNPTVPALSELAGKLVSVRRFSVQFEIRSPAACGWRKALPKERPIKVSAHCSRNARVKLSRIGWVR
jgi:hypothetical protein